MIIIQPQVKVEAADLSMVKAVTDNSEASHREAEAKNLNSINANFRTIGFREACIRVAVINIAANANLISREINQILREEEAMAKVLNRSEDTAVVGLTTKVIIIITSIGIILMISRLNSTAHPVAYAVVSIIPLNTATKVNMISIILWKR